MSIKAIYIISFLFAISTKTATPEYIKIKYKKTQQNNYILKAKEKLKQFKTYAQIVKYYNADKIKSSKIKRLCNPKSN